MISILIAAFEQDIRTLVQDLHQQATGNDVEFEIIIHDNGSDGQLQKAIAESISRLSHVFFFIRQCAGTRSASRNWMARKARYPYLLFMDGDAMPVHATFIRNYLAHLPGEEVVVGGTAYRSSPPPSSMRLRWVYGVHREQLSAKERTDAAGNAFSSFNFLMPKTAFEKVPFDEKITAYGHEDSLLATQLELAGIPIIHIDNPLYHEGLDESEVFLRKSAEAVSTLCDLAAKGQLGKEIKLLRVYQLLLHWRLDGLIGSVLYALSPVFRWQLQMKSPSLKLFDLWRLGLLWKNCQKKKPRISAGLRI